MTWPTCYGGSEASPLTRLAVVEELLVAGAPIAAHWFAERQVGPSLLTNGTPAQRRHFLPRIAAGECYIAIGMSEPGAGSDLASVTTRASRTSNGWRVNGTKIWTSGADESHYLLALVRTDRENDRHGGLSQLLIPLDSPGIAIRPIHTLDDKAHLNEVVLEDVYVDDFFLVGEQGGGWDQVIRELSYERSGPERYLSFYLLLAELARHVEETGDVSVAGQLCARLWAVRALGLKVAAPSLAPMRSAAAHNAALVKDVGTSFERDLIEECRRRLHTGEPAARRLASVAVSRAPTVTLRGGTSEVLRDVISRDLTTHCART